MVRQKKISSRELIQAHLNRINQVNPKINAIIELVADKALARADAADQALARGENWGPLHGVPVTIKDAFETAGIRTTCGTMGLKDNIPKQNATAVQRLLDAGAIILGKTNTPELTMAYETDNLTDGRTLNPYALDRSPGGSSGGEAAAIASGCSPLGLGNDCGGSIRVPSHFTGVAGLCPTWGRVPISGLVGRIFGGSFQTAFNVVAGPMARFVEDLALALPLLSGPDARDPFSYPFPLSDFKRVDLKKLRIAFYADNGFSKPHPAVRAAVETAAESLKGVVAEVDNRRPPRVETAYDLTNSFWGPDFESTLRQVLKELGTAKTSPPMEGLLTGLSEIDKVHGFSNPDKWRNIQLEWHTFISDIRSFLTRYDAIVCPSVGVLAPQHGTTVSQDFLNGTSYNCPYALAQLPAVTVRCGTSQQEGLPVGVQVVAPFARDDIALRVAHYLEEQPFGGWQPPPTL